VYAAVNDEIELFVFDFLAQVCPVDEAVVVVEFGKSPGG